jgi:hypothetical protein
MENTNDSQTKESTIGRTRSEKSIRALWPVTFPALRNNYKPVKPTINEPVILRYSHKALNKFDCENMTYNNYRSLAAKGKRNGQQSGAIKPRKLPAMSLVDSTVENDCEEEKGGKRLSAEDQEKSKMIKDLRAKLFGRFPEVKTIFTRRNQPINYLKQSYDYKL